MNAAISVTGRRCSRSRAEAVSAMRAANPARKRNGLARIGDNVSAFGLLRAPAVVWHQAANYGERLCHAMWSSSLCGTGARLLAPQVMAHQLMRLSGSAEQVGLDRHETSQAPPASGRTK